MTKTDLQLYHTLLLVICDLLVTHHISPAIDDFKNYMGNIWFYFCHNFFKNYPQDLKIV